MKRSIWTLSVLLATVFAMSTVLAGDYKPKRISSSQGQSVPSIAGTTWSGIDSDGDYYDYTFLPGGQLRFRTNTSGSYRTYEDEGDEWAQNGPIVIIVTSRYTTRQGRIVGNHMEGDAWNFRGQRWTWQGDKQ